MVPITRNQFAEDRSASNWFRCVGTIGDVGLGAGVPLPTVRLPDQAS